MVKKHVKVIFVKVQKNLTSISVTDGGFPIAQKCAIGDVQQHTEEMKKIISTSQMENM